MKVSELIEALKESPPDAEVLFDTEARLFNCHMVPVDNAGYEPLYEEQFGRKAFILGNDKDGRHDQGRITWYDPKEKMPEIGDCIVRYVEGKSLAGFRIGASLWAEYCYFQKNEYWTYAKDFNFPEDAN